MKILRLILMSLIAIVFPAIAKPGGLDKYINSNVQIGGEITSKAFLVFPKIRFSKNGEAFILVNASKTEMAIIDICCGSVGVTPQRISVRGLPKHSSGNNYNLTKIRDFSTDTGVRLGMTLNALIKMKGDKYKKHAYKRLVVIEYTYQTENESFLQAQNMPSYFGKYFFNAHGLLTQYDFGFDYP